MLDLHAVDRRLRDAAPRNRTNVVPFARREARDERAFALSAIDDIDERRGPPTVAGWHYHEPPPPGRHVPRVESCRRFDGGLVVVVVGVVLVVWGLTGLIDFLRRFG